MPVELIRRTATLDLSRADAAARTVAASLSSESPVQRGYGTEVLEHTALAVDLIRAGDGLPLLWAHDQSVVLGVVENVRIEARRLIGLLRFGGSARAIEVWNDVMAGVLKHISVSYRIIEEKSVPGGIVATRWMPYEASLVSVPADHTVGIGRSIESLIGVNMPNIAITPADEIRTLCRSLPEGFADALIATGATVEAAKTAVLGEMTRRDLAAGGNRNITPQSHFTRVGANVAEARTAMIDALASRMGTRGIDMSANQYRGARMLDLARDHLELAGQRTTGLTSTELIQRAYHTTGDFNHLLVQAGNRLLLQGYAAYQGGLRLAAKPGTIKDFRPKSLIKLSEAPSLLRVNEHGEFKYGSMTESREGYSLATYGRIFSITRQALINDDLSAFETVITAFAAAAAELENGQLVDLLTMAAGVGPTLATDSKALFHVDHGNLATGGPSALADTSLATARAAMRLQKGLDGKTPISAEPRFLIVPAALENKALQLTTATTPAAASEVNPAGRNLTVIVDPRLDAKSATAWYLAADPMLVAGLEYSYLEGDTGPVIESDVGFEVDGIAYKCRLDFGCGAADFRGLYRSAGA